MRGADEQPGSMFSYVSLEERVPADHPLRAIRQITDRGAGATVAALRHALRRDSGGRRFRRRSCCGRCCCRSLYTIRSERLLMEQLDYNLLFRWFVGLGWMTRCGRRRRSRRIATGCWTATSRPPSSTRSCSTPTASGLLSGRAFHRRRHVARGVGEPQELPPRTRSRRPAGRWGNPTVNFHGSGGRTTRIGRRRIPTRGSIRRRTGAKRGSAIWATC